MLHPLADTRDSQEQGQLDIEIWSSRKRSGLKNKSQVAGPRVEAIIQEGGSMRRKDQIEFVAVIQGKCRPESVRGSGNRRKVMKVQSQYDVVSASFRVRKKTSG